MAHRGRITHTRLMCGAAMLALLGSGGVAVAQESAKFDIAPQALTSALNEFAVQSPIAILYTTQMTGGKTTAGVSGESNPELALNTLLAGTGLTYRRDGNTFLIVSASDPQSGSAAGDGAGTVEALIVTAQKREENIQDVPIAMSAFTQEELTRSQVAGGPDLITQVPNMTFTKTNFSSYSIQIRGIGTQAISATTDPAVSVAFNNTPFIRNHFFEQEFYDLQRVEVLRGPQGTLYGRNATAGVVNVISQKPRFNFEAKASADVSNYSSSRIEGMVNIPLVEDKAALRLAGAWTKRNGFATNQITGNQIDGRDLWSTRVSLRVAPTDAVDVNLIWEHFEENDDRLRSGKQLCTKDVVTQVAGFPVSFYQTLPEYGQSLLFSGAQASFSQGCKRGSLYSPETYQTPNGLMIPYYLPLGAISAPIAREDPYVSTVQSPDLRVIESTIDPDYRAKSDLGELQASFDLGAGLTLTSETAYSTDYIYSLQDFNRFNTAAGAWDQPDPDGSLQGNSSFANRRPGVLQQGPNGGIFCDPQLGCSDRLVAVDIATAKSRNFSQELRLSSDYDGPFNFSLGANFLRYDTEDKYYVFINSLTLIAAIPATGFVNPLPPYAPGVTDNGECQKNGYAPGDPSRAYGVTRCVYIDPNPIDKVNDRGHNYFLSRNPYKLVSYAAFGEAYYNITDNLKLTAGVRWTVDKKDAPRIPTWLLAGSSVGTVVAEVIDQEWREPTGRLAIDWKPDLSFTDETLLYASAAHGYKAGGANPPGYVFAGYADLASAQAASEISATRPKTFDPEFVNAFELGTKNTLADGRVTLNLAAFYYDYTDYQISEIVDRSAYNRNFDATVWGLEIESDWRPVENLRLGFKGGYENTRIADGERAIDLMDRTAGNPDWIVTRPFPTFASSCVLPAWLFVGNLGTGRTPTPENPELVNLGAKGGGASGGCELAYYFGVDPAMGKAYTPNPTGGPLNLRQDVDYPAWSTDVSRFPGWPDGEPITRRNYPGWDPTKDYGANHGEGFFKQLGGNQLPNAPHWTATVTGDYTLPLPNDWLMTLHTDVHWQSQSWWRVFNDDVYDKLHPYFTMNLAAILTNEDAGWNIMAYIKNVTDETAITGAFLNSDDTGLTTNVFLTEPRLYGLRVTKQWTGGPLLGNFGARHDGPYPFTVELGGMVQRHDAPNEMFRPDFMSAFASNIDLSGNQADDLDWGDGRDIKLTYAPGGGWKTSVGVRFGKTNQEGYELRKGENLYACNISGPNCVPNNPTLMTVFNDYGVSDLREKEEHTVADFRVGHDMGFGPDRLVSTVSGGLRYAELKSRSDVSLSGTPDWIVPATNFIFLTSAQHHEYQGEMTADRSFDGFGPMIAWDASAALFEQRDVGRVGVDWSVSAGVLFGHQKASVSGGESFTYWADQRWGDFPEPATDQGSTPLDVAPRSKSVTVPVLDLSLGLSYKVDRFNVGAGYSWERYFDAIDGGITEHQSYDRTIDGPYFKVSVGFGG